jgi:NitT/TauT family transport system permease protein
MKTKCSSTSRAISLAFVLVALWAAVRLAHTESIMGQVSGGYWYFVIALAFAIWATMSRFTAITPNPGIGAFLYQFLVPGLFGVWLIVLWELITVGLGIPRVLLPPPSLVGEAIASSLGVLAADFRQTIIRAVIPGFVMGNLAGFAVALWADRVPFLRRGLLPVGNLVSAIPIVGIAPIMVMWFGFDWQSKAAVVVIMTFFPMLINTVAGLGGSSAIELDLMRSIGASHWQTFTRVRLPNALPFVFNALKINSALALIGAIVAEFFGTPIVGIGFRISTEAGRMNMEMVWASIALSAVSGSLFYGLLAVVERRTTFWHPSFRQLSAKRL